VSSRNSTDRGNGSWARYNKYEGLNVVTSQDPEGTYQSLEKYGRDLTRLAGREMDPSLGAMRKFVAS